MGGAGGGYQFHGLPIDHYPASAERQPVQHHAHHGVGRAVRAGEGLGEGQVGFGTAHGQGFEARVGRFEVGPVRPSTVVIHGEDDDVVPLRLVLDWARPQELPVSLVPGTGHFFHGRLPVLARLVRRALASAGIE